MWCLAVLWVEEVCDQRVCRLLALNAMGQLFYPDRSPDHSPDHGPDHVLGHIYLVHLVSQISNEMALPRGGGRESRSLRSSRL